MTWLAILGLALANNLDNAGVGLALGVAGIRIPALVNLWIAALTFAITALAAGAGHHFAHMLPATAARLLSACILCVIGLLLLRAAASPSGVFEHTPVHPCPRGDRADPGASADLTRSAPASPSTHSTAAGPIRSPASLRQFLVNPSAADADDSRHIDMREATVLAMALNLNNIGGGFSAGLIHLNTIWIGAASGAVSYVVLWICGHTGLRAGGALLGRFAPAVAGALLILIGLMQLH